MTLPDWNERASSRAYWDARFTTDWDLLGGREQSRLFMDLLVRYLPAALYEEIAAEGLSLLDCGCAKGDGTAVLAAEFPGSRVAGFDWSPAAVAAARAAYPHVEFFTADFAGLDRTADVLVSSHCFEHLEHAASALAHLASRTRHYLLILVPFQESYPVHHEHLRVVHAGTFPQRVNGWQVSDRIALPPVPPAWAGNQLLLIYRPEAAERTAPLASLPTLVEVDQQRCLHALEASVSSLAGMVAAALDRRDPDPALLERIRQLEVDLTEERARFARQLAQSGVRLAAAEEELAAVRTAAAERDADARRLAAELTAELAITRARVVEAEAAGAERSAQLIRELGRGHLYVEGLNAEHQATVTGLRQEIAALTARLEEAAVVETELVRWQSSRLWRTADLYWQLRRRLGRSPAGSNGAGPQPRPTPEPADLRAPAAESMPARPRRLPLGFPAQPAGRADVIVFSIIDWDFRFQRPQQIATQLGRHGHRVFFLSTTEFLPPSGPAWELTWKAQGVAEVRIRSRRFLDVYRGRLDEEDLEALVESFGALQEELAMGDAVSLVEIPFWAPLADRLRRRSGWRVVYDCMDEWANFPGIGSEVLGLEEGLTAAADVTLATARLLYDKLDGRCRRLALVPNGVDLEHYGRHYGENGLLEARHPLLGYYGALASWVDVPLLEMLARRFPAADLVLAGGAFDVDLSAVAALPNVRLLGQRPYAEMPQLLWHFDVCVIPFVVNDITEATNPVKLYEYLFSGKPVVAPRLAELAPFAELCYLADGREDFLAQVEGALAEPADAPVRERRRALAAANDWRERYRALWQAVAKSVPLVSVIVVTHGGLPLTRDCLESLLQGETWPRFEVLVVDNASPDATPAYLRALADVDPRLRLILLGENAGFPAANNLGLAQARGDVVLLLNNDTVVPPGLIGRLVGHLERDPELGLVGACTNFCGNEARVEPGYTDLADLAHFGAARARRYAGQVFDLPVAALYCVAARRAVVAEVGPLDERFGIGMFEDDDYSLRVRQAGYRVVCAEDAYVHHVGQGTFKTLAPERYEALWKQNQAAFEAKWGRTWEPHRPRPGVAPVASRIGQEAAEL